MSETRATIRARVQLIVGSAINTTINAAIKTAHRHLQRKHNYSLMETSDDVTVADGGQTFSLPTDFKALVNPEVLDGTTYTRMRGIIKNGLDGRSTTEEGVPVYFRIWGGVGHCYPMSEGGHTIPIEYYRWLPEIASDDQELDTEEQAFLDMTAECIEHYAIAAGLRRLRRRDEAQDEQAIARGLRMSLEDDDDDNALQGIDLLMELPG